MPIMMPKIMWENIFQKVILHIKELNGFSGPIHIAGGAPRDAYLLRPVKDVDVFINMDPDEADELFLDADGNSVSDNEYIGTNILRVYNISLSGCPVPIQIINDVRVTPNIINLYDTFDIGFCMISYDPINMSIIRDWRFDKDLEEKKLTIYRNYNYKHVDRIIEKYPEFHTTAINNWHEEGGEGAEIPPLNFENFLMAVAKSKNEQDNYEDLDL